MRRKMDVMGRRGGGRGECGVFAFIEGFCLSPLDGRVSTKAHSVVVTKRGALRQSWNLIRSLPTNPMYIHVLFK